MNFKDSIDCLSEGKIVTRGQFFFRVFNNQFQYSTDNKNWVKAIDLFFELCISNDEGYEIV